MISNHLNKGIDTLIEYIEKELFPTDKKVTLLIPYTKGDIYNILKEKANVINTSYLNEGIKVEVVLSKHLYELYKNYELV